MADETVVPIQGQIAGSRTITVTTFVDGVPTPVQMQVVALSDANGIIIDPSPDRMWQRELLAEMRILRQLVAQFLGVYSPAPEDDAGAPESSTQ